MTTVIGVDLTEEIPEDIHNDSDQLEIEVNPTSDEVYDGTGIVGGASQLPAIGGSMTLETGDYKPGLMIRSSGGRYRKIHLKNDEQKARHTDIRNRLLSVLGPNHATEHPHVTINVSKGYLEENGQIIGYVNEDPNSDSAKALHEMRQLYHDVLGQKFSDMVWHDYKAGDRASDRDPMPFQKREECQALKRAKCSADEVPKDRLPEHYITQKLQRGIIDFLDKQIDSVDTSISTKAESRKGQLAAVKERFEKLDEMVMGFHAAYPPPDISALLLRQEKIDALHQYKATARDYVHSAVKSQMPTIQNPFTRESQQTVDDASNAMATELALMACVTRQDYDLGCLALKTKPCRTTPEIFLMRLGSIIADQTKTEADRNQYIEQNFSIAFGTLSHKEDRDAIRDHFAVLIPQIQGELTDDRLDHAADSAGYNRRLEHLAMVKKQKEIAKDQKDIATDLRTKKPALAATADEIQRLGGDIETLAGELDMEESNDKAYKLFLEKELKAHDHSLVKDMQAQVDALKNEPADNDLNKIIRQLESVIKRLKTFETFIDDKGKPFRMPFTTRLKLEDI